MKLREIFATICFMTAFCMMMTPLAILAFGIPPEIKHAVIGTLGLFLFFVFPMIGAYGDEL